jgi:crotonobetainyl-CoA hydratase
MSKLKNITEGPIRTAVNGAVLEVTIDRPKANAIDAPTSRIMGDVFSAYRDDDALRCAILTSTGERFFCPGWDLKAAADGEEADANYGLGGFGGLQELPGLNKPVVCAVNGLAYGGGFEIMISCDIIIAAEHATFALPEIRSGVIADAATIKLPRRIPYHVAMEMLLTGRSFDTAEAKHWGIVNEVVPAADLMTRAREVAENWQAARPWSTRQSRKCSSAPITSTTRKPLRCSTGAACRRSRSFMPPKTSSKAQRPLPKSAIPSGRAVRDRLPSSALQSA